jgi:hypothetical protein
MVMTIFYSSIERVKFAKNHPDLFFDEDFLKMMLVPKLNIDKINELIRRK